MSKQKRLTISNQELVDEFCYRFGGEYKTANRIIELEDKLKIAVVVIEAELYMCGDDNPRLREALGKIKEQGE